MPRYIPGAACWWPMTPKPPGESAQLCPMHKPPGLDAMLDEIRSGNVATVIIKDQSRIGRDVINEWYVADTSRKIKTVFKSRMEKGSTINMRASRNSCRANGTVIKRNRYSMKMTANLPHVS